MLDTYNKSLASLLYSKLGGNVNHDSKSVFCELMDNSLDETYILLTFILLKRKRLPDDEFITLYFQDNGNGINNISNLFNGSSGKKDKMGITKLNIYHNSLVYITGLTGYLEVFSIHNFDYKYVKITFTDAIREYENQINTVSSENINYDQIGNKIVDLFVDDQMIEHKNQHYWF